MNEGRFELAYGGKYYTEHFYESLGGGAANVAIGAKRLGLNVTLKTVIGDNGFRSFVEERLQKEHLSYLHSHFDKNYHNVSCILLSPKGEKTVVNYRTPHQTIFSSEKEKRGLLRSQAVFLANLPDVSMTQKTDVLNFFKRNRKFIFANLGADDCRRSREQILELLSHVDILIVNAYEFADIMKTTVEKLDFKKNLFYDLKSPNLRAVIVTHDKKGSYGYAADGNFYQIAVKPQQIIDSTGAGDGYSAAFIASYLKNQNISQAMEEGAKYASVIMSKIGAN